MGVHRDEPLYISLYREWRDLIVSQSISAHTKLPAIRQLAQTRNVSKTTVERAYHQLTIEGYVESREKSGHYVVPLQALPEPQDESVATPEQHDHYINLTQNATLFDLSTLRKAYQHVLSQPNPTLFHPANKTGEPQLRKAILKHLAETREVKGAFDQVLIAAGIQNHLMLLAASQKPRSVAFIEPLFDRAKQVFEMLEITLMPCDTFERLCQVSADWIYLSPSNRYPGGDVLSIADRLRIIEHAQKNQAWIIEDDYNHFFRYNAYQIPAIQGLAKGERVIYIGSFSRTMPVSTRISYMIVPRVIKESLENNFPLAQTVSTIDQLTMAEFMMCGAYARQLKKLSAAAKRHNAILISLTEKYRIKNVRIWGLESNMHMMLTASDNKSWQTIKQTLQTQNLYFQLFDKPARTLLVPYGGLDEKHLSRLFKQLCVTLGCFNQT